MYHFYVFLLENDLFNKKNIINTNSMSDKVHNKETCFKQYNLN